MGDVFEDHIKYSKALRKVHNELQSMLPETAFILIVHRDHNPGNNDLVTNMYNEYIVPTLEDMLKTAREQGY